jgi:hypothetical protein
MNTIQNKQYEIKYNRLHDSLIDLELLWNTDYFNSGIPLKRIAFMHTNNPTSHYIELNHKDLSYNRYSNSYTQEQIIKREISDIIDTPTNYFNDSEQFLLRSKRFAKDHSILIEDDQFVDFNDKEDNGDNIYEVISDYVNDIYFEQNYFDMTETREQFVLRYNNLIDAINELKVNNNDTHPLDYINEND